MNQLKLFNEVKRELTFEEYNKQIKAAQIKHNNSTFNSRARDILKAYLKVERAKS